MTDAERAAVVERLERSRADLLEALTERTEGDFARALGGSFGDETLGRALAALAAAERADLATARAQVAPRRDLPEQPLPPQVTHDLAGARHQTLAGLGGLTTEAGQALVEAIVERESALVAQVGTMLSTPAAQPVAGAEPTDRTTKPRLQFPVLD